MAKSKTYEMLLKISGKADSSLRAACSAAEKDLNTLGEAAKKVGQVAAAAVAGAATAAVGIAASSLSAYAEFEQAMDSTAVTARATAEEYELMEAAAREMGAKTTKTATEAAEAMGYMALAGWDVEQSMAGLEPILRASEATGMDLARCSDLVTDSMSALGLEVTDMTDMTDYLDLAVQAQRASNTTAESLLEAFIGCGGAAKTAGVDMGDLSTALGVLANNGTKGSEAGTALNSMLSRMTTNDAALSAFEDLGVAVFDSTGNFRGLETVLGDTSAALSTLSDAERLAYMKNIAGTNYFTQMSYLLAAVTDNAGTAEEYLRATGIEGEELAEALANTSNAWSALEADIMDHSGVLMEVAEANTDNLAGATARFQSAVSELQLQIGEQLAPYAQEGLEYLANDVLPIVSEKLGEIVPQVIAAGKALWENRNTILTIGGAVMTAVGAFKSLQVASAALGAVKNLSTIFSAASQSGGLLAKVLGIGNVKLLLIAGAIAAAAAGFVYLWGHSEKFRTTVIGLWEKLQPLASGLMELAGMIGSALVPVLEIAGVALVNGLGHAAEIAAPVIENVIGIFTGLIDFITGALTADWGRAWQGLCEIAGNALDGLANLVVTPINAVIAIINSLIEAINQCGFTIPDWVPIWGGKSFSPDLPTIPTIPALAAGGIVTAPTILEAGEGGEPEAVLPLSKLSAMLQGANTMPGVQDTGNWEDGPAEAPLAQLAKMLDDWTKDPKPRPQGPGQGNGSDPVPAGWQDPLGGGEENITWAPTFNFYGPVTPEEAKEAGKISATEFKRLYRQMKAEERRKDLRAPTH